MKLRFPTWYWGKFVEERSDGKWYDEKGQLFPRAKIDVSAMESYEEDLHGWHRSEEARAQRPATVVNRKHSPFDVYIGRPSKWGNPYTHRKHSMAEFVVPTREEAIAQYRTYLLNNEKLLADLHELRGRILGCWCHPEACHGDVLAEVVNHLYPPKINGEEK